MLLHLLHVLPYYPMEITHIVSDLSRLWTQIPILPQTANIDTVFLSENIVEAIVCKHITDAHGGVSADIYYSVVPDENCS